MAQVATTITTPVSLGPQTVVSNAPTGKWTHPRFDEIHRRLAATTFGESNVRSILANIVFLLASVSLVPVLSLFLPSHFVQSLGDQARSYYLDWVLTASRAVATWNIATALRPLFRHKDDLSDIPLTPTQRALLGLGPASRPATPGSQYITPPRYSRSSTPRSRSASLSGSPFSDSPLNGRGNNDYSPSASPLFQKAIGREQARRLSLGSPSPLGVSKPASQSASSLLSNTPSPSTGRGASVGLNSRWLYERGRSSPSGRSAFS